MAVELGQLSRGLLKPAYGAGESLAAPGEADSAVQSARLELGLLASLANDPGASFFLLHDVDCIATLEGPPRFRLCRLCAMRCPCAGLNPLIPYLSKMLAEQVRRSLKSAKRLSLLLKVSFGPGLVV